MLLASTAPRQGTGSLAVASTPVSAGMYPSTATAPRKPSFRRRREGAHACNPSGQNNSLVVTRHSRGKQLVRLTTRPMHALQGSTRDCSSPSWDYGTTTTVQQQYSSSAPSSSQRYLYISGWVGGCVLQQIVLFAIRGLCAEHYCRRI